MSDVVTEDVVSIRHNFLDRNAPRGTINRKDLGGLDPDLRVGGEH
jgi:hypothetical protein